MKRGAILAAVVAAVAAVTYALFIARPAGPRSLHVFDPDHAAVMELDMWQAYYAHRNIRLFTDLVVMTHDQNRYPWAKAVHASFYLARAAETFSARRDGYDVVLPDLTHAYAILRDWTGATFDPAAVARAELAWWVARRIPGEDTAEHVGGLIADENALIYGVSRDRVLVASILRARAGKLRDDGGDRADWSEVGRLLRASYRALYDAVGQ